MKDKRWFPIFYMFITTAFFSAIVIGLTLATRERVQTNETLALEQAVLRVLPGLYDETLSKTELHQIFETKVTPPSGESGGAYVAKDNGDVTAYAVPIGGEGFWAPIHGFIGVADDRRTVTGIAFYEQNETPGLGAEIETPEWRAQFEDLTLADGSKAVDMRRPGEPLNENAVHAVTGATQTSVRVEKLINASVNEWRNKL